MDRGAGTFRFLGGSMISATLKASIAIAFMSLLAVNVMDRAMEKDRAALAQMAAQAAKGGAQDPMTTGSVRKAQPGDNKTQQRPPQKP